MATKRMQYWWRELKKKNNSNNFLVFIRAYLFNVLTRHNMYQTNETNESTREKKAEKANIFMLCLDRQTKKKRRTIQFGQKEFSNNYIPWILIISRFD